MAKSKYCPEVVEAIIDAIRATGGDKAGWEAEGISEKTFYIWCNKYHQFLHEVTRAKKGFRETWLEVLKIKAMENLCEYLVNGATITTTSR